MEKHVQLIIESIKAKSLKFENILWDEIYHWELDWQPNQQHP